MKGYTVSIFDNTNYYIRDKAHSGALALWKLLLLPLLFFSNNEDGFWGDDRWNPERKKDFKTFLAWWTRNPAHDICFHIWGFTDKITEMWGPFVPSITNNTEEGGWNHHWVRPTQVSVLRILGGVGYGALGIYLGWWFLVAFAAVILIAAAPSAPFPFISYVSKKTVVKSAYAGWRPSGAFGFKFQIDQDILYVKYPWVLKIRNLFKKG